LSHQTDKSGNFLKRAININTFEFSATSESEAITDKLAQAFVNCIPGNTTIALSGTLGAGKTRFVQGIAVALGGTPEQVTSPTFVICNQYPLKRHVFHLDAYRIKDADEFLELGVDEMYLTDGYVFIEWAEKFSDCLPREQISLNIVIDGEYSRRFEFSATTKYVDCLTALARSCTLMDV